MPGPVSRTSLFWDLPRGMKALRKIFGWEYVILVVATGLWPAMLSASGGQLWSFGQNHYGQLCDGTSTNRILPAQVLAGISTVVAGGSATDGSHTLYLKTDGTLWAVGYNIYGQLGDSTTTNRLTPVQVASSVSAVSAGINHSLFLKTDGTMWAMGFNQYGQLGDGTTTNRSTPVQVASGVSAISAGGNHTLFLKTDGTLWAAGYNSFGQLGDGTKPTNQPTPVQITSGVSAIAAGGSHSLFLKTDNSLWVTGWNASGQLGIGPASSYLSTPTQLTTGVSAIAAGNQHSLFLKTNGTLWAMGQNLFGQLGDGTMPTNQKLPVQVTNGVGSISAGVSHSLFLKTDGSLWAMGLNTTGQLGDGTTNNQATPVHVTDEVLTAVGGSDSSYFIKAPGLTTQFDSWTQLATGPTNSLQTLVYEDSHFVAGTAGIAPAGSGGLSLVSADGLSWTSSGAGALTNIDLTGIAFGNGLYLAVGTIESGGGGAITTSIDGVIWSASTSASQALRSVAYGSGLFVAVGDGGLIQTSPDGTTWTARSSGTGLGLKGVAFGGGQFVAVGSSGAILTSLDGVTWTARTAGASGSSNNLNRVTYGNGQFVAVGNGILTSNDGANWTQRIPAAADGTNYFGITYAIGQFLAVGTSNNAQGAVLSSPDGIGWTAHNPGVTSTLRGVAYGSNHVVVVGDNGTVLTSAPVGSAPVISTQPLSQTIYAGNFVSFSVAAYGAPPFTYQWRRNATVISGATNLSYSIAAADTVDAGSLTAVVTNAAGNVTSAAATLTVLKADQNISFAAVPTHYFGDAPFTLTAAANPSGLPVTFSVVSGPVTLSGNTVTITGIGTATIRASQSGNISYYAAPNIDRTFAVGKGTPVIAWAPPTALTYGTALSSIQLNATANLAGAFAYSPVSGAVLGAGTQTLTVTFTPTDTTNYNSATAQQTLTVNKAVATVTLGNLNATYDGAPHAATATTSVGALAVDFTYNGSPTVPVNAGSYAVVGTISNVNYIGSASGTLVIAKADQTISFNALSDQYFGVAPIGLSASASPSGLPVTFSVAAGPATIAGNLVTLTGVGSVTLRASQSGNANYNAAPDVDRTFPVLSPMPVLSWTAPAGITYGTALSATQLNATSNVPGSFVYSPAIGTVLNAGMHTLTATFTPTDIANYSGASTQQTITVAKVTPVLNWSAPAGITYGVALDSTQLNATAGSVAGSFTYNPAAGTVLGVGTQSLAATFTPTDSVNYNGASTQQTIAVSKGVAVVTLGSLSVSYDGTPKSATATTNVGPLAVDFTYNGTATPPTNVGSYAVVGTINSPNYSGSASGTLTIAKANQSITFDVLSDRTIGDLPFGLLASATPSALPVAFSVLSGPATLSGNIVTLTGVGAVTIRASQSGNASYNEAANVDRVFNVVKAMPVITWSAPSAITYGTPLSSAQLNATADVPGSFTYNPASGSVPTAGTITLSVAFSPSDSARYGVATAQQTLTVNTVPGAPAFTTQPQSQTVLAGVAVSFSVVATATLSPTYQWQKDGINLAGATGATLTLSNVQSGDTGSYRAVATNGVGSVSSNAARLVVVPLSSNRPATFDAQLYLDRYPELQALYGGFADKLDRAWTDYIEIGIFAGRSDGDFDPAAYLAQYADLRAALGNNLVAAALHWYLYGRQEGRRILDGFDVNSYLSRYPEVRAIFGTDLYGAWVYYRDHGIYQGEIYDELFRVEEYLALYPELFAIFGTNLKGALIHWLTEGRIEGRLGRIPLEFSAQGYCDRNPDVAAAVNRDPVLAWQHFWLYGIYEGRAYDDEFRVFEYLAINQDLQAAFLSDWRGATLHWMRYGRTEGRLGRVPLIFNVGNYLAWYPDVAATWGTNPTTVWQHFWLFGIDEGRIFDNEFRVDEYLALNPDLAAALGTDRRKAFMHWVRYGRNEGRLGRYP